MVHIRDFQLSLGIDPGDVVIDSEWHGDTCTWPVCVMQLLRRCVPVAPFAISGRPVDYLTTRLVYRSTSIIEFAPANLEFHPIFSAECL